MDSLSTDLARHHIKSRSSAALCRRLKSEESHCPTRSASASSRRRVQLACHFQHIDDRFEVNVIGDPLSYDPASTHG